MIGHLLVLRAVELVATLIAVHEGFLRPTISLDAARRDNPGIR